MKKFMVLAAVRPSVWRKLSFRMALAGAMVFGGISPALASIYVNTYINLLTSPSSQSSSTANTSVNSHSASGGGVSNADADTDVNLYADASSHMVGLSYPSNSTTQFSSGFSAYTSPLGAYLPPGTIMVLSGSMSVGTNPSNSNSIASSKCSYRLTTMDHDYPGSITLRAQGGIPTLTVTGAALLNTLTIEVIPMISIDGTLYELDADDMDELEISYDLWAASLADFQSENFSTLATTIADAIYDVGLTSAGLSAGSDVDVGFDVSIDLGDVLEFTVGLRSGTDNMTANMILGAQSSTDALADLACTFAPQ